jgi:L-serine dehydratase
MLASHQMISTFDLFKIGIGPSSSHTMGPMIAAHRFRSHVTGELPQCARIEVTLYGSLAWTGKGNGTDRAICLGLLGEEPDTIDADDIGPMMEKLSADKSIKLPDERTINFDPASSFTLEKKEVLHRHSNAMRFTALDSDLKTMTEEVYYSIGGGFSVADGEETHSEQITFPYPFRHSADLLQMASENNLTIAELQRANEGALHEDSVIDVKLDAIRDAMFACIDRGMTQDGFLPGNLKVKRRAKALKENLLNTPQSNNVPPHEKLDWVSACALAVNEENAAGGRVVTAPTNGASGVVPAVLHYYKMFYPDYSDEGTRNFLLTSAAIGALIKLNASISGAEVGCQGEVGSAAAMAAAGLAAVSGGSPMQIENAAEIALEHHLGMTCDPISGLVQIPCIERNAIGAQKAIAAAALALRGDGIHRVSLDEVIETMRQTGIDMRNKYKETSRGGLAVNVAEC